MRTVTLPTKPMDVGPFLRSLRVQLGIKQMDVCYATGSSQSVISSLENGHTAPMFTTVMAYLRAIGCTLEVGLTTGAEMPDTRPTKAGTLRNKVFVPRPHKRKKEPPKTTTNTGRCLRCFTTHEGTVCPNG
jgi:transcriptional regulator with XRE-family HTH domain